MKLNFSLSNYFVAGLLFIVICVVLLTNTSVYTPLPSNDSKLLSVNSFTEGLTEGADDAEETRPKKNMVDEEETTTTSKKKSNDADTMTPSKNANANSREEDADTMTSSKKNKNSENGGETGAETGGETGGETEGFYSFKNHNYANYSTYPDNRKIDDRFHNREINQPSSSNGSCFRVVGQNGLVCSPNKDPVNPNDIYSDAKGSPNCKSYGLSNTRGFLCLNEKQRQLYTSRGGNATGGNGQIGSFTS